jgi:hypothetical protein
MTAVREQDGLEDINGCKIRGWEATSSSGSLATGRMSMALQEGGFGVWGLGFGVWGLGFGVWGLGFGVWGLGFGVWGLGFGV